ncbi:ABC transporter permease [Haloarcula sp. S1CR25-12]|uniref:ABC transporter permease n=1 Tax=Haloarcula saliterrae TaxID=2950534 RepID=A0ABU2FGX2_9EURY|nr:ABC transporter permease [Haloarcula sp. S1CR25-12]MDS0260960.1 ABC transporter permease [Haloarcula sp. S1CR25-12]
MSLRSNSTDRSVLNLIRVVAEREVLLQFRYPLNLAGILATFLLVFSVIFFGGRAIAGQAMDESISGIVIGYFLWMMSTTAFMDIGQEIGKEAEWGTLERHFITPFSFGFVLFTKAALKLVVTAVLSLVMLAIMLVLTGEQLQFDALTIVPVVLFSLSSVFGVGFAIGGLSVLYKQVSNWMPLLQFAFAGLIAAPTTDFWLLRLLPLVQGSNMLQAAMKDGVRLWSFSATEIGLLVATGVGYLVVGYAFFTVCQRRARHLGVLGDY